MTRPAIRGTEFHFWMREEGDISCEAVQPGPLAKLDTGAIVRYHLACQTIDQGVAFCEAGGFRWRYLGSGQMYTIDGVMQFASPAKPGPIPPTDIHQPELFDRGGAA